MNEPIRSSCVIEQTHYTLFNAKTQKVEEQVTCTVTCYLKREGKIIYEERLPLPFPTDPIEAAKAAQDWLDHKVKPILKEHKWTTSS
jgi:hypothetical protein